MRASLLLIGTIACSAERGIVQAPVASGPAPAPTCVSPPLDVPALRNPEPQIADDVDVGGTTWDVCSPNPHPGRYAFLPSGGVSLEGNFVAYRAQLGHWTWSQKGGRVTFGNTRTKIDVRLKNDTMIGSWYMTATPELTHSICLRRVVQP